MLKRDKKITFSIISFLVSFIFIVFVQSMNIDNINSNIPLKSEKESAIFFDKETSTSENYISVRISRTTVLEIFMGRDSLPNFVKKMEENLFFKKIIKLTEKKGREIISLSSILQRYKERILLI